MFCPLITYYNRVLGLSPVMDFQQQESKELHEELREKMKKRKFPLKDKRLSGFKPMDAHLMYSERLNVLGRPDLLLKSEGEVIPVDFKFMRSRRGKAWPDHRAQIGLYALLIEDVYDTVVRRGFIYYALEERAVEVKVTPPLRRWVLSILREIREMDESQEPPKTWRNPESCSGGCGYRHVCV